VVLLQVVVGLALGAGWGLLGWAGAGLRLGRLVAPVAALRGRWLVAVSGGLGLALGCAAAVAVYRSGIEVRALPWGALVPVAVFAASLHLVRRGLARLGEAWLPGALMLLFAAFGLGGLGAAAVSPPKGGAPDEVLEGSRSARWAVALARSAFDDDGDGFPTAFCGDECDCDDGAAGVNPAATDAPDNGVDEDCDGRDLRAADVRAMVGLAPLEAPAAAPVLTEAGHGGDPTLAVTPPPAYRRPYNVLLVVMDTVRADHLGAYGYERPTSPRLDALAARATLFEQPRAQGPKTRESLPSLLTGRYYEEVHRRDQEWPIVHGANAMVAELFRDAGYATFGISSFIYVLPRYGFDQGFDVFDTSALTERAPVHWSRTSDHVTDRTLAWLDAHQARAPEQPVFLMTHYADPHAGYLRHAEAPRFGAFMADIYDEEIWFTDHHIGRLLDGLEARGLAQDTVVVVTADHGEGLEEGADHGHLYHGQTLYDNVLRVPLIVHAPGLPARRVAEPVALIDVVPTLLDLTGVPSEGSLSGVSLVPWMQEGQGVANAPHPPVFSVKALPHSARRISMVAWPHKVIWRLAYNRWQLYDLARDPGETRNLARTERELLGHLRGRVQAWRSLVLQPVPSTDDDPDDLPELLGAH
jgi:arylsulfatase A-like enzyme